MHDEGMIAGWAHAGPDFNQAACRSLPASKPSTVGHCGTSYMVMLPAWQIPASCSGTFPRSPLGMGWSWKRRNSGDDPYAHLHAVFGLAREHCERVKSYMSEGQDARVHFLAR